MTDKTIVLPPNPEGNGNGAHYRLTMMVPKRRYLSYLRERWWVVLAFVAVAVSGVFAFETLRAPSYTSFAELYTADQVRLGADLFDDEAQTYYGTQIELLKSTRLQNAALDRTGYTLKKDEKLPTLEVTRPQNTALLMVEVTGRDPAFTQHFLQALIDEYLAFKKATRQSTSEDIVSSLTDQVAAKERDLKAEQDHWTEFQRSNNVAVLEEESKSAGLYLSDLNLQLAKLNLESGLLAAALNSNGVAVAERGQAGTEDSAAVAATSPTGTAPDAGLLADDSPLESAKLELAVLRAQQEQTRAEHGDAAARRMGDSITNLQQRVAIREKQQVEDKKTMLDQLQKRIVAIQASIPVWEAKVLNSNERLAEGERLKNNIAREQSYYDHLLATLQNVDLGVNVQPERTSLLQTPTPAIPVPRNLVLRLCLALVFGMAAGMGVVFGWYMLDDRFVSVRDVKEQFGEAILGMVPQIKVHPAKPEQALLQANDARWVYAESFRHLRSALLFSVESGKRPQTLLFTGAAPAEGKTTVAVNLARVLASSGLRVVLVDADLHHGRIHRFFGGEGGPGLADFLGGSAPAESVIHGTSIPGLDYVSVGTVEGESEGVFLRPNLGELLNELKSGRDFLILDGPPILAADDAALLVPHVDGVVLVLRPFFSSSGQVRQTLDMLYQRQAKQVSIIFNQARRDDFAGQYADRKSRKLAGKNGSAAKA